MEKHLRELATRARSDLAAADSLERLRQLEVSYLGRRGEVTSILRSLGSLPPMERPVIGQQANVLRRELSELLKDRAQQLQAEAASRARREQALDVTLPGIAARAGRVHPLMRAWRDVERIFVGVGFDVAG